ncbi:hypothetical protein DNHGIG_13850 [Collibacillus ludicampi]|uniref:DUF3600 domain-containing protein n=1 Tax=Collibacillus ludicampi TaxID=2771369 RepID=A0AAV4LDN6_9BACL|nr:DUF3600 domain-containing protein [Collibacillus ludicampi]GIM45836.1 hypothetical protein DNHGIG_13850 [Collibacillus ludicampi]
MNFENQIRSVLQENAQKIKPSAELKEKILSRIEFKNGGAKMKKRLIAGALVAVFLIPSGAFAYSYLVDQVYGSKENFIQAGGNQKGYEHLESKLQRAKSTLSAEEFGQFILLLKDMAYYNVKMADIHGNLHPERLSAEDQKKYEQIKKEIQPYFDKLNSAHSVDTKVINH